MAVAQERMEYSVEVSGLDDLSRALLVRALVTVISEDAASFETDIPLAQELPEDVRHAAAVLGRLDRRSRHGGRAYLATGVQLVESGETWDAFSIFAPYAYDASVWAKDHVQLVSLADNASSIVALLTEAQASALAVQIGPRLVPVEQRRAVLLRPSGRRRHP